MYGACDYATAVRIPNKYCVIVNIHYPHADRYDPQQQSRSRVYRGLPLSSAKTFGSFWNLPGSYNSPRELTLLRVYVLDTRPIILTIQLAVSEAKQ